MRVAGEHLFHLRMRLLFAFDSHDDIFLPVFNYLTMPAGHALFTQVVLLRSSKTYDLKIWRYRTISTSRKARWKDISLVVGNVSVITMYLFFSSVLKYLIYFSLLKVILVWLL